MRRTIVARSPEEVQRLRFVWASLPPNGGSIFQSYQWNYLAARCFADTESPFVVYRETDSGAALIPAAVDRKRRQLTMLGEKLGDYRDVLATGDESALHDAWHRLAAVGMKFSFGGLRSDAHFHLWQGFNVSRFYGAPRVEPKAMDAERFAAEHNKLGRWFRRLEKMGVQFCVRNGGDSRLVRFIYQQKGKQPSENGANAFADPRRVNFMEALGVTLRECMEIFTLETAGNVIAALVTFRDRNARRFYTIYFDEQWAKYSPGMCLLYEVTRRTLAAGIECDYMTGEQGYKMRLATSVVPLYWVEASAETLGSLGVPDYAMPLAA